MRGISPLSRPTADIIRNIGRIHRQEIRFLIEPSGPTKFHVKQIYPASSRSGTVYTVSIGAAQLCTCGSSQICIHILYVMIRYFGVPKDSPLLYQRSLSDGEINALLERRYIGGARSHHPRENRRSSPHRNPRSNNINSNSESSYIPSFQPPKNKVNRLNISEDDLCPICYDSLFDCPPDEVAWCSFGCGGNFHVKCVQEWIYSQNADGKFGSCPLCRVRMDEPDTSKAPNQKDFDDFRKQRENHSENSEQHEHHSNDTCASEPVNRYIKSVSQNKSSEENESYLAMLRRELESSSQSHARMQQQLDNQRKNHQKIIDNINNNIVDDDDDERLSMPALAAQIAEIDDFINTARAELDREMTRLKEHQRQVQASIEAQIKAGAALQTNAKNYLGRKVEPVLKVRVPIFDSQLTTGNFSQAKTQRSASEQSNLMKPQQVLPRMIESTSINRSTRSGQSHSLLKNNDLIEENNEPKIDSNQQEKQHNEKESRVIVRVPPSSIKQAVRTERPNSSFSPISLHSSYSENQVEQLRDLHSPINIGIHHNTNIISQAEHQSTTSEEMTGAINLPEQIGIINQIQNKPNSSNSPVIARPAAASPSSSLLFSSNAASPPRPAKTISTVTECKNCSSSLSDLPQHLSSPDSFKSSPDSFKSTPDSLKSSSSLSNVPSTEKPAPETRSSRLLSLIDDYCSMESYKEPPVQEDISPPFYLPHHQQINHQQAQNIQIKPIHSSIGQTKVDKEMKEKSTENKRPLTKTVNLNDTFNILATHKGNITDGLTLAQQQARENEIRLQRTLNPTLTPKGLSAKRASAAKSRLQAKRSQNQQSNRFKNQSKLGWSS